MVVTWRLTAQILLEDDVLRRGRTHELKKGHPLLEIRTPGRSQVMSKVSSKAFDSVQSMRQIRDGLSAEIANMSYDELICWLRAHQYRDPVLQRLAAKAAEQADPAARPPAGP